MLQPDYFPFVKIKMWMNEMIFELEFFYYALSRKFFDFRTNAMNGQNLFILERKIL